MIRDTLLRPLRWLAEPEVIGETATCPIFLRWELINRGPVKVMVHRFLPNVYDLDYHDHPRAFLTFVFRGGYVDESPVGLPGANDLVTYDRVRAPAIRYRQARHVHRTRTGPRGSWSLVIMGPVERAWGFWRGGVWFPWRRFLDQHGHAARCG